MSLSLTQELRARVPTPQPWPMAGPSSRPPAPSSHPPAPAMSVFRRTFRPGGKDGASYTLSLFDSGAPHPEGGCWLGYRLHRHDPKGPRRGLLLFAGADQPPPREGDGEDLTTAARDVLERLTLVPGDLAPDPTDGYGPEQLAFAIREARTLRELVRTRLGWRPEVPFNPRADLEATYTSRALLEGGRRHRASTGVVTVEGTTRRAVAAALLHALGHHACAEPEFLVGASGNVYALCPHGAQWAIYVVTAANVVTKPVQFEAATPTAARVAFEGTVQRLEAAPKRRPSVRAA